MFIDNIKKESKTNKVKVFFDMDGVLAEYRIIKEEVFDIPGFYTNLRPLKESLKFMKRVFKIKNVEACILSCCRTIQHKKDKLIWLKKYAPYLKPENIHIICYEEITFDKKEKHKLKEKFLLKMKEKEDFIAYHIDDDVRIIKAEKSTIGINIVHLSSIIR